MTEVQSESNVVKWLNIHHTEDGTVDTDQGVNDSEIANREAGIPAKPIFPDLKLDIFADKKWTPISSLAQTPPFGTSLNEEDTSTPQTARMSTARSELLREATSFDNLTNEIEKCNGDVMGSGSSFFKGGQLHEYINKQLSALQEKPQLLDGPSVGLPKLRETESSALVPLLNLQSRHDAVPTNSQLAMPAVGMASTLQQYGSGRLSIQKHDTNTGYERRRNNPDLIDINPGRGGLHDGPTATPGWKDQITNGNQLVSKESGTEAWRSLSNKSHNEIIHYETSDHINRDTVHEPFLIDIKLKVMHKTDDITQNGTLVFKYMVRPESKCVICQNCQIFFSPIAFLQHGHRPGGQRVTMNSKSLELAEEAPTSIQLSAWQDFQTKLNSTTLSRPVTPRHSSRKLVFGEIEDASDSGSLTPRTSKVETPRRQTNSSPAYGETLPSNGSAAEKYEKYPRLDNREFQFHKLEPKQEAITSKSGDAPYHQGNSRFDIGDHRSHQRYIDAILNKEDVRTNVENGYAIDTKSDLVNQILRDTAKQPLVSGSDWQKRSRSMSPSVRDRWEAKSRERTTSLSGKYSPVTHGQDQHCDYKYTPKKDNVTSNAKTIGELSSKYARQSPRGDRYRDAEFANYPSRKSRNIPAGAGEVTQDRRPDTEEELGCKPIVDQKPPISSYRSRHYDPSECSSRLDSKTTSISDILSNRDGDYLRWGTREDGAMREAQFERGTKIQDRDIVPHSHRSSEARSYSSATSHSHRLSTNEIVQPSQSGRNGGDYGWDHGDKKPETNNVTERECSRKSNGRESRKVVQDDREIGKYSGNSPFDDERISDKQLENIRLRLGKMRYPSPDRGKSVSRTLSPERFMLYSRCKTENPEVVPKDSYRTGRMLEFDRKQKSYEYGTTTTRYDQANHHRGKEDSSRVTDLTAHRSDNYGRSYDNLNKPTVDKANRQAYSSPDRPMHGKLDSLVNRQLNSQMADNQYHTKPGRFSPSKLSNGVPELDLSDTTSERSKTAKILDRVQVSKDYRKNSNDPSFILRTTQELISVALEKLADATPRSGNDRADWKQRYLTERQTNADLVSKLDELQNKLDHEKLLKDKLKQQLRKLLSGALA